MVKPHHDWHLGAWLKTLGRRQADLVRDLDMNKAKASLLVSCKQQYTRDDVNALSEYLNIMPHELLMHPADAMAMRSLKADLIRLAHTADLAPESEAVKKVSLG